MPYNNLAKTAVAASMLPWYRLDQLMAEVRALRAINFAIVEHRQQSLERLAKLPSTCPYTSQLRFPAEGMYVCEGLGDWPRKLMQLKSALNYKDSSLQKATFFEGKQPQIGADGNQAYNDAQQSFWNATTAIMDEVAKLDMVFDRDLFEQYFGATWT